MSTNVHKFLQWRVQNVDRLPSADTLLSDLHGLPRGEVPTDVADGHTAFKKMNKNSRRRCVQEVLDATPKPPSDTPAKGTVQPTPRALTTYPVVFPNFRGYKLEVVVDNSGVLLISIRCIADAFCIPVDGLKIMLSQAGFEIVDLNIPNEIGELKLTACIHSDEASAAVATLDTRGMTENERNRLYGFRRHLPSFLRGYRGWRNAMNGSHDILGALELVQSTILSTLQHT